MSKKVVVLSTSLRSSSNSELLAKSFVEGARDTGNEVEYISLKNKEDSFLYWMSRMPENRTLCHKR